MKNLELKKVVSKIEKLHKEVAKSIQDRFATVELDNGVIRGKVPGYQYETTFPCLTGMKGQRCHVNIFDLTAIIKKLPASANLRFIYTDGLCNVEVNGKNKYTINGEFVDNNKLDLQNYSGEFVAKTDIETLQDLFTFCTDDELRHSMTGIYFDSTERFLVATDAHRLKKHYNESIKNSFILPNISKFIIGTGIVYIYELYNNSEFTHKLVVDNCHTLYFRAIDGRYPNWAAVYPSYDKQSFAIDLKKLQAALKESLVASDSVTYKGIFHFNLGEVSLSASSGNLGYKDTIAKTASDLLPKYGKIGFNIDYLLKSLPDTDKVTFSFGDHPNKAIELNDNTILMPMMI